MNTIVSAAALATATAVLAPSLAADQPHDPIYSAIDKYRAAWDAFVRACDDEDQKQVLKEASRKQRGERQLLANIIPTTPEGLADYLEYVVELSGDELLFAEEEAIDFVRAIARGARAMIGQFPCNPKPQDEAELITLGSNLRIAIVDAERKADCFNEICMIRNEHVEENRTWPEDQSKWTRDDANAYLDELRRVEGTMPEVRVAELEMQAAFNVVDACSKRALSSFPKTVGGLGPMVQAAGWALWCQSSWHQHDDDLDFADRYVIRLIERTARAAHVSLPTRRLGDE